MAGPDYGSVSTQTSALYTMLRTAQAARGRVTQLEQGQVRSKRDKEISDGF
jgi:hypothetical protein